MHIFYFLSFLLRVRAVEKLGLLSDDRLEKHGSPLDTLSNHLAGRLAYEKGERDLILMRHEVKHYFGGFTKYFYISSILSSKHATKYDMN